MSALAYQQDSCPHDKTHKVRRAGMVTCVPFLPVKTFSAIAEAEGEDMHHPWGWGKRGAAPSSSRQVQPCCRAAYELPIPISMTGEDPFFFSHHAYGDGKLSTVKGR